jgi:hypothetical protein
MPHARVPPPPPAGPGRGHGCGRGMARRGEVRRSTLDDQVLKHFNYTADAPSPPGSWLTQEPLYMALSGHPSVDRHNTMHTDIPVPWLARTGPWGSRSLRDVRRIESSSARVKTSDHVFGECLRHDYSLLHRLPGWRCCLRKEEDRHCYLFALHRAG